MSISHQEHASAILQRNQYMSVATASNDGVPWNTPLFFAYDNEANLFWASSPDSRHSKNIDANGHGFVVIFDSAAKWGTGFGLYIESAVVELTDPGDIKDAIGWHTGRAGRPAPDVDTFTSGGMRSMYRAVPTKVWMNDSVYDESVGFVSDVRVEIPVAALRNQVSW